MATAPDLIMANADIITMGPGQPRVQAVPVIGAVITATGTDTEVAQPVGPDTQTVDLAGGVLAPGFVDPYSHVLAMALLLATRIVGVAALLNQRRRVPAVGLGRIAWMPRVWLCSPRSW